MPRPTRPPAPSPARPARPARRPARPAPPAPPRPRSRPPPPKAMAKNRLLISVVAAALAGFLFYNFALKPKQTEASDVKAKVATAQGELSAAQASVTTNR